MVNPLLDSLPPIPGNALGLRSQARLEETLQPRYEPAPPSQNPAVPHYTGLILLSILTFLFLLFLLFKKQIKEVRFATFATVLIGVGLPILAIVQLTTDLVLREDQPPAPTASPRREDQSQQPPEVGEDAAAAPESGVTEPTEQPETTVVEVPLNFPNPASESGSVAATPGDDAPEATNGLTLSMAGATPNTRPGPSSSPEPPPTRPLPAATSRREPSRSPFAPITDLRQGLQRSAPRSKPGQPSFSLSHLDFSQPIRFERILRLNLQGLDVLALQKLLQDLEFYNGSLDGYLGRQTAAAIAQFQAAHALLPDDIFGLSTCEILNAQTPDLTLICAMTALGD